jgi:hypothetical protein
MENELENHLLNASTIVLYVTKALEMETDKHQRAVLTERLNRQKSVVGLILDMQRVGRS